MGGKHHADSGVSLLSFLLLGFQASSYENRGILKLVQHIVATLPASAPLSAVLMA